jgi:predicted permease
MVHILFYLLWFEYEMSPTVFCVERLVLQLLSLIWEELAMLIGVYQVAGHWGRVFVGSTFL